MGTVHEATAHGVITAPPAKDGYRPITDTLWTWARIGASGGTHPTLEEHRYVLSAARRCDSAHRQLLRIRHALVELEHLDEQTLTTGGPGLRRMLHDVLGDVDLFLVALYRAIDMVLKLKTHFGVTAPVPPLVDSKRASVKELRDAFEHIEDRALGMVKKRQHPDAVSLFDSYKTVFVAEEVTYAGHTLALGREATELLIELRNYLRDAWAELCAHR